MQDEISEKIITLSIRAGKETIQLSHNMLKEAIEKFLKLYNQTKNPIYKGKQTLRQLTKNNTSITNIEITDKNIKSFEKIAKKYNIDFALKKDKSEMPPRYLVFFKGRDVDVITQAFKEFTAKKVQRQEKPSIIKALTAFKEKAKQVNAQLEKVKNKFRGQEL